jgi:colanic acid/amylovoran biosynthesis glycosyltransferase
VTRLRTDKVQRTTASDQQRLPARVAIMVWLFPKTSETFILDHVTGLLDSGIEVDVIAEQAESSTAVHPAARRVDVVESVVYTATCPHTRIGRAAKALPYALRALTQPWPAWRGSWKRVSRAISDARTAVWTAPEHRGRRRYDVIHCHFGPLGMRALALRSTGILDGPIITTFHGRDISHVIATNRGAYDRLFREGELFLTVSRYFHDRLLELGCPPDRVRVHHMGIDTSRFSFEPRRMERQRAVRLLSVARMTEKKGLEYALRALARLDPVPGRVSYRIVGSGPLHESLERLTYDLGLGRCVEFTGAIPRNEVIAALRHADLFIAPSVTAADGDQEGIPVSIMEAMATGLPILSTLHSGIPELVEDGVSGFTVPERDPDSLADRLKYLLDHPETWEGMGRAGRNHVLAEFDQRELLADLTEIYREVVGTPSLDGR